MWNQEDCIDHQPATDFMTQILPLIENNQKSEKVKEINKKSKLKYRIQKNIKKIIKTVLS